MKKKNYFNATQPQFPTTLEVRCATLGLKRPDTLFSMNNLAALAVCCCMLRASLQSQRHCSLAAKRTTLHPLRNTDAKWSLRE
jgi:hypothetical protein